MLANVISKKGFHLVFHSNFARSRLIFLKITATVISRKKIGLPIDSRQEIKFLQVPAGRI